MTTVECMERDISPPQPGKRRDGTEILPLCSPRALCASAVKINIRYIQPRKDLVLVLFLLAALNGCGGALLPAKSPATPGDARRPERIISLSPSTTEILYGVGAFGRVVAVSDYCQYPPEAASLPHIGGWQNINLERIAALHPDLIIMTDAEEPLVKDRLDALGVRTLAVRSRTIEDALSAIEQIGRATGNYSEAQALAAQTRRQLEEVSARTRNRARPRVLCVVDRVPGTLRDLYAATGGSFLAQLIETAGGQSVAPPAEKGYTQISKEAVVALDPDIIIDMVQGGKGKLAEDPKSVWQELPQIKAVRDGRIYSLHEMSVIHPSQFVGETARRFAQIIHPEVFGEGPDKE